MACTSGLTRRTLTPDVGPDCERPEPVDEQAITQTDWPQQYRRDSGWGKNRQDHPNEVWYMQQMLPEALAIRAGDRGRHNERDEWRERDKKRGAEGDPRRPAPRDV